MSHPYHHAKSSVTHFGGHVNDYIEIHKWLDCTKAYMPDVRHRALRHHSFGIFECEQVFGTTIENHDEVPIPVRLIAEKHIIEDVGFIPTPQDWLNEMKRVPWMANTERLSIEAILEEPKERLNIHDS